MPTVIVSSVTPMSVAIDAGSTGRRLRVPAGASVPAELRCQPARSCRCSP